MSEASEQPQETPAALQEVRASDAPVTARNPEAFAQLRRVEERQAPHNPEAFEALAGGAEHEEQWEADAPPRRRTVVAKQGRPIGDGARKHRTLREKLRKLEAATDRHQRQGRAVDLEEMRAVRAEAVTFAVRAGLLGSLSGDILAVAQQEGVVTESEVLRALAAPRTREVKPTPAARRAQAEQPATASPLQGDAGAAAGAVAATQPAVPTTPPPPPQVMGQDVARVQRYAAAAALAANVICHLAQASGVDASTPLDRTLFAGTPAEFKVSGTPSVRLTELLAVEGAATLAPKADAGSPTARRLELAVMVAMLAGPALAANAGKIWDFASTKVGAVKERLRARREGRA